MLKSLFGAILIAFALASAPAIAESEFADDEKQITERVMDYFWGMQNGDQDRLANAFDLENGEMKSIRRGENGDEIRTTSLADFRARMTQQVATDSKGQILSMDIVKGQMAFVKFSLEMEGGKYIDYILFYKKNGEWKIVSKIYATQ